MDDAKWARAAGAGGILFVVMIVVGAFLPGSPPATGDPAPEIAEWFLDNGDAIRVAALLSLLAVVPVIWWVAALYQRLEQATGNARLGVIAAVGVAVAGAAIGVQSIVFATVAMHEGRGMGGIEGVRFFYVLGSGLNAVAGIGSALVAGAVAAGILRTAMMPRWVGWLGAVVALLGIVASPAAISTRDAVMVVGFVGFLLFAVWVVVVSVLMLRTPEAAAPPPASAPA